MPKLTKRAVDAATPDPARRFFVWDAEIKGFGLLVLPSGVKSYVYQYRTPEGRTRRATIGQHGEFTPDGARAKAEALRRAVHDGRDPLEEKREQREAKTVGDVLDAYVASAAFAVKAAKTKAVDLSRIECHLRPLLGRVPIETLTPDRVRGVSAAIRDGRAARGRARGGPGASRKAIRLLKTALAWGLSEGLAKSNPAAAVKTGVDGTRDVILEDVDAYRRMFETLATMEAEGRIRRPVADAIRVIALTGARRSEVTGMRWGHVDLRAGVVILTAHKTGAKTGRPRVIGLPAAAQAVVARQPERGPGDFVFASARKSGPIDLAKSWVRVRAAAGLPAGVGLHALRHSAASHMAMGGATAPQIMGALGHASLAMSQRYVHVAQDARQQIAERVAAVATAGMAAAAGGAGDVVPLKGGA